MTSMSNYVAKKTQVILGYKTPVQKNYEAPSFFKYRSREGTRIVKHRKGTAMRQAELQRQSQGPTPPWDATCSAHPVRRTTELQATPTLGRRRTSPGNHVRRGRATAQGPGPGRPKEGPREGKKSPRATPPRQTDVEPQRHISRPRRM